MKIHFREICGWIKDWKAVYVLFGQNYKLNFQEEFENLVCCNLQCKYSKKSA